MPFTKIQLKYEIDGIERVTNLPVNI